MTTDNKQPTILAENRSKITKSEYKVIKTITISTVAYWVYRSLVFLLCLQIAVLGYMMLMFYPFEMGCGAELDETQFEFGCGIGRVR